MIVCSCNVLSDHDVRSAVERASPRTTGEVYGCLGCSAQCGRCARTIREIMDDVESAAAPAPPLKHRRGFGAAATVEKIEERRMKGDPKVVEYLNKALRHELTAVNQYWLHYRLLDNWGYKDLAKQWRKESIEEMEHADKLVERIIFLDGFPNMQVLDPLHIGQNVKEVLDCDLAAEMSARALYQEAATYCHSVKDYVTRDLFEKLM